jgi:hypothetical protein
MKKNSVPAFLVIIISVAAVAATVYGIFSNSGNGAYYYRSIRGQNILVYGKGLYRHMSADVAPQGIAQDFVTLLAAVPLLLLSWFWSRKGSLKNQILLTGVLFYLLVTYVFYMSMAMYNSFFLLYVILSGTCFFTLASMVLRLMKTDLRLAYSQNTPFKSAGIFLMMNAVCIGMLWLSVIIPPLFNGTIIPVETEHYTTLIVQAFDLSILLPLAFISGWLFYHKRTLGLFLAPVYLVFLSLLMTALTAKLIAMAIQGFNVVPAVFIIPVFNVLAILFTVLVLKQTSSDYPSFNYDSKN